MNLEQNDTSESLKNILSNLALKKDIINARRTIIFVLIGIFILSIAF